MLPWNIGKRKCPNVAFLLIVSNVSKVSSVVNSLVTAVYSTNMGPMFHYFNTFEPFCALFFHINGLL